MHSSLQEKIITQSKKEKHRIPSHIGLLGLACFMAYTSCYAGRSILSAIMPQMLLDTAYTRSDLGSMGAAFFFTYGVGQIINGIIGDRIKARFMVPVGLFFTGILLSVFPFLSTAKGGAFLWGVCGALLAMLWGPLSKVIAENTSSKVGSWLLTSLTVASLLGTLIAYFLATYSASRGSWKLPFYLISAILILTAFIWYAILTFLEKRNTLVQRSPSRGNGFSKEFWQILLQRAMLPMLFVAMINGVIRNAVTFWIPTFITEKLGFSPTFAAGVSGILPFINLFGTFFGLYLLRRLKSDEFRTIIILFFLSTAMFFAMGLFGGGHYILILVCLFIACAAMSSASNLIFSVYSLKFTDTGRISFVSGLINFASYAATSGASSAFGKTISAYGWDLTVYLWVAIAFLGLTFAIGSSKKYKEFNHGNLEPS